MRISLHDWLDCAMLVGDGPLGTHLLLAVEDIPECLAFLFDVTSIGALEFPDE